MFVLQFTSISRHPTNTPQTPHTTQMQDFSATMAFCPHEFSSKAPAQSRPCIEHRRCCIWANIWDSTPNTQWTRWVCSAPASHSLGNYIYVHPPLHTIAHKHTIIIAVYIHSLTGRLVWQKVCILPTFAALWSLYFSLVQVSQAFGNQSDNLLLEAGFITLLLAPLNNTKRSAPTDKIAFVMIRWLLMRYVFSVCGGTQLSRKTGNSSSLQVLIRIGLD